MSSTAAAAKGDDTLRNLPESLWISILLRALPAIIGALVITFTQDHNARFGFAVFGAVVLWSAIIIGFEVVGIKGHPTRVFVAVRSLLGALAGGFSLFMATGGHDWATAGSFILTVAIWGIVTGLIELVAAYVSRKHALYASEILIAGALTMLLGIAVALVPPELNDAYGGHENVEGSLTADVQSIGFVGAYFALLGVLLVVEAISLRAALRRRQLGAKEGAVA
ncbi:hypothetical protein [Gulosibacter faecalis]|jgi:hypothetical protein|uniref:Integral membrane protein n=1 Tax=Gulosibacter faecalis TaxID=272240 RepID=A0ABW5UVX9_9MICO|nr:hypothetical protein [Gulosibacter faecalis]